MSKARDIMDRVAADLIRRMESADPNDWRMPWHGTGTSGLPTNVSTGNAYRGGNVVVLWIAQEDRGYPSPLWATYKQHAAMGHQVRKGERGVGCVKWSPIIRENDDGSESVERMVPRAFTVFNVAQVDGYEPPEIPDFGQDRHTEADAFFRALGATIHEGTAAFYRPGDDSITLPPFDWFPEAVRYYSTTAHEHVHWTSHDDRTGRGLGEGRAGYAFEELVAEMGAAMVLGVLGLCSEPRDDHAQYLASWAAALRDDPKILWSAASKAQKATDWLTTHASAGLLAA